MSIENTNNMVYDNHAMNVLIPFQLDDKHYEICPALFVVYNKLLNEAYDLLTNYSMVDNYEFSNEKQIQALNICLISKQFITIKKQLEELRQLFQIIDKRETGNNNFF